MRGSAALGAAGKSATSRSTRGSTGALHHALAPRFVRVVDRRPVTRAAPFDSPVSTGTGAAAGAITGSGSDHMQKIGDWRAINIYNPFLAMWVTITRGAKWYEGRLHPEEALTREQALRFYTINNAQLLFKETRTGSLEPGKLADLALLDTDLLTCAEDKIAQTKALLTMVGGKVVWETK
jgi:predicted amidohydrolase YtcJ